MKGRKKKVVLDYRHDKCKLCGGVKLKTSPYCRPCYKKKRLNHSLEKKDRKQLGRQLANQSERRLDLKKKYDKLRDEFMKLEKKILPQRYSYNLFLHEGEKYLKFAGDLVYPLTMMSTILKGCQKTDVSEGSEVTGMILQIPNPFPKKRKKKPSKKLTKAKKGKSVKRSNKNVRRKSKPTKSKSRRRRK